MKGATAEPFDNTTRPPKINIMTKIGINQNFLRDIKNVQISFKNDMVIQSELIFERTSFQAGRVAMYPVTFRAWFKF